MRNLKLYIGVVGILLLFSCSGDDNGGNPFFSANGTPDIPGLIFPTNNLVCTNFNLEFDWNTVIDIDGDTVSYVIDIATDSNFAVVVFTATTTATKRTFTLEKGITYYWRVKARDSGGNESGYSTTQSFFTEPEAETNTIPTAPQLISPMQGERISGSTITLDWNATDSEDDALSYDLYLGDTNPPVLFSDNINVSTLDVTVSPGTVYYWRVVVKDTQQSAAIGQVWNFKTE
ncbi:hypothetical protein [Aquimarina sp. AU474]|uniref:hypothetical protein n=1 Tax=Aquimarina sp. AU474 TaxID=2108529 RepID=UPI000D69E95A|nr:hypothetical protein [Aquimarina sp. AU474]